MVALTHLGSKVLFISYLNRAASHSREKYVEGGGKHDAVMRPRILCYCNSILADEIEVDGSVDIRFPLS
jgi:hypothetical protein